MNLHAQELTAEELKNDEQQSATDLLKLAFEFRDYAIVVLDAPGHIINWNTGAQLIFGYDPVEIMGRHVSVIYTAEDIVSGLPDTTLNQAMEKGTCEFEVQQCKKDGVRIYTHTILTVLYNADKSVKGFGKIIRDISKYKKLEKDHQLLIKQLEEKVLQRTRELVTVNNELEAFSYSVSHDLRAPLRAISGFSMMLKKKCAATMDSEANRFTDVIVDNTKMMSQLIDDLLSFSRMARLEAVDEAINMRNLAELCSKELLPIEKRTGYSMKISEVPDCRGDSSMLRQVWYNLIDNAIKYSSKKNLPEIEIGAIEDQNNLVYYIKDNGTGFDMKYAAKLFGVFQRLHRQDEFEGTGLGLALARRIISKHGGRIWAESVLHEGTILYFSIPKI